MMCQQLAARHNCTGRVIRIGDEHGIIGDTFALPNVMRSAVYRGALRIFAESRIERQNTSFALLQHQVNRRRTACCRQNTILWYTGISSQPAPGTFHCPVGVVADIRQCRFHSVRYPNRRTFRTKIGGKVQPSGRISLPHIAPVNHTHSSK